MEDSDELNIDDLASLAVENFKKLPQFYAEADSDINAQLLVRFTPKNGFLTAKFIEPEK